MEANLLCEQLRCQTLVFSEKQTREETAETVVPDTMPDIAELLDSDAQVFLRSKEIREGKVTAEGQIAGTILYLGEESPDVQKIELSIPCTFSFDAEETGEEDAIIASLCIINADARALNPRKLLLRVDVRADLSVYRAGALSVTTGAEPQAGLQTLLTAETVFCESVVTEKTFVISEELVFPTGSAGIVRLLLTRSGVSVEEVKTVGGKMILQGTARADVLYQSAEENEIRRECVSAPFSQIMDAEENAAASVYPVLTAAYIEPLPESYGVAGIHIELHVSAQVLCRGAREIVYLADAYSIKNPCSVQTHTLVLPIAERETVLRETLQEKWELNQNVSEIVSSRVLLGVPGQCENGVSLPVGIRVLCKTEKGTLVGASLRRSVTFALDVSEKTILRFDPARLGEWTVAPSGGTLEVRMPIELHALMWEKKEITMLTAIETQEDTPLSDPLGPSLTVARYREGTLWELAKKYASTTALVENANPAPIKSGDLLLIPRAR